MTVSEEIKNENDLKYEVVIGLEVHAQLKTKSKIFAPDGNEFGLEPNTQTSTITLGLPGVLPVLNKEVVNMGILCGLALNCEIPAHNILFKAATDFINYRQMSFMRVYFTSCRGNIYLFSV